MILFLQLFEKLRELAFLIVHQVVWAVIFQDVAEAENEDAIACNDSVETMCNRDHSGLFELGRDQVLDLLLGHHIDVGRRLVEDDQLRLSKDGPANAEQLSLSRA